MSTSTPRGGNHAESRAEIELEIKKTIQKLIELEKDLEVAKPRETEEKKRKYDDFVGPQSLHHSNRNLYSMVISVDSHTNTYMALWRERLEIYTKILRAISELSDIPSSSIPFDRISLEEVEAPSKASDCINAGQKVMKRLEQSKLSSSYDKIIALSDKVLDYTKEPKTDTKPDIRGG